MWRGKNRHTTFRTGNIWHQSGGSCWVAFIIQNRKKYAQHMTRETTWIVVYRKKKDGATVITSSETRVFGCLPFADDRWSRLGFFFLNNFLFYLYGLETCLSAPRGGKNPSSPRARRGRSDGHDWDPYLHWDRRRRRELTQGGSQPPAPTFHHTPATLNRCAVRDLRVIPFWATVPASSSGIGRRVRPTARLHG